MLCVSLAKTYVNTFREKLKRREVDLGEFESYVTDSSSVQLLVGALASNHERQILYGLQLLQSVRGIDFSKELLPLLSHSAPYIRQEAARTLQALPVDCFADAERLLNDASDGVRLAAIDYLCSHDAGHSEVDWNRCCHARATFEWMRRIGRRTCGPTFAFSRNSFAS
jgi:hypothetical protein